MELHPALMCTQDDCMAPAQVELTISITGLWHQTAKVWREWACWECLDTFLPQQLDRDDVEQVVVTRV